MRTFYTEFDTNAHPDWEEEWEQKLSELGTKYKKNERDVRAKSLHKSVKDDLKFLVDNLEKEDASRKKALY